MDACETPNLVLLMYMPHASEHVLAELDIILTIRKAGPFGKKYMTAAQAYLFFLSSSHCSVNGYMRSKTSIKVVAW